MGKSWQFQPHDSAGVQHLNRAGGISPVVAQLLVSRGITDPDIADRFLAARLSDLRDPELLPGVISASARIVNAIRDRQQITIYGDYDADGMCSIAILFRGLRLLGAEVDYYVPNRLEEGYGLNSAALCLLAQRGTQLVISVDCGIGSVEEAEVARHAGLELIITDHHEPGAVLPNVAAIVHPRLPGSRYPFGGLCGAGVAFKLIWHVCQEMSQSKRVTTAMRQFLLSAMGLAAIGTVADVVPLLDENRVLVRHGLTTLKGEATVGLQALMQVCGLDKKPRLASDDIAFAIGPRLNAAGRLGEAGLGVELLSTDSWERADEIAHYMNELNQSRVAIEREISAAARNQVLAMAGDPAEHAALVVAGADWHPGVIGIVAGRLCDEFYRPTIVISLDPAGGNATGSGRSIPGFPLSQALAECSRFLVRHGGHAAAAGLQIRADQIELFRQAFTEHAGRMLRLSECRPFLRIDAEAGLPQMTLHTVKQLEQLSPFGQDHPRPTLCARGVRLGAPPKRMGAGERHLSVLLEQNQVRMRAVAFHHGDWVEQLQQHQGPFDIAYRPVLNEYGGRRSVEVHLVDWHPAE